jgi:ornithine carbamoyltransferase
MQGHAAYNYGVSSWISRKAGPLTAILSRHLISLRDMDRRDIDWIVTRALSHASGQAVGESLTGKVVGTYFSLTSTRTRTAFNAGAMLLGAHVISYGPTDLQLATGETWQDTVKVLAGMLDGLVVRAPSGSAELESLSLIAGLPVINAMSLDEHPTQALADLTTMWQQFGPGAGVSVLYLGEGNSTASALALALARYPGAELHLRTPVGYGVPDTIVTDLIGRGLPGTVTQRHDLRDLPEHVDVIYTTQWHTTGTVKQDEDWRAVFAPFAVDDGLMARYPSAVFMHDLPAHRGDEVAASVIDGPRSIVFCQAKNKLYSAMAALEWCLAGKLE